MFRCPPFFKLVSLFVFAGFCYLLFQFVLFSLSHPAPTRKNTVQIYPSDSGYDIKQILCKEISRAKSSIELSTFGLSDLDIIRLLDSSRSRGLFVKILDDSRQSKRPLGTLVTALESQKSKGLYHRKWLIIDDETAFLGSTNCSEPSFLIHDNLLVGIRSQTLVNALRKNLPYQNNFLTFYPLPGYAKNALSSLVEELAKAKHSISLFMYTLTHPKLLKALIEAKDRGVLVSIYLDRSMAKGVCRKAVKVLWENGIVVRTNVKSGLIHHKSALIDNQLFIFGSANWTAAGFGKNDESIFFYWLNTPEEIALLKGFFNKIHRRSIPFVYN